MTLELQVKPGPRAVLRQGQIWTQCKSLLSVTDKTEHLEGQSRCHNIVVEGIKESGNERASEAKVRKLFSEKLQLDHLKIELDWAHRAGKSMSPSGTALSPVWMPLILPPDLD